MNPLLLAGSVALASMAVSAARKRPYVLSVDVDAFVTPTAYDADELKRLPAKGYEVMPEQLVLDILRRLGWDGPAVGVAMDWHSTAPAVLRHAVDSGVVGAPYDLVHLDAHGDMGFGETVTESLLVDWLKMPKRDRRRVLDRLSIGNWVLYPLMWGDISSIVHLRANPSPPLDVPLVLFREGRLSDRVSLIPLSPDEYPKHTDRNRQVLERDKLARAHRGRPATIEARFEVRSMFDVSLRYRKPDFVVLCRSPDYTPKGADRLFNRLSKMLISPHGDAK